MNFYIPTGETQCPLGVRDSHVLRFNPQLELLLILLAAIVMIGLVWLWGHLRMALGIEDPAEWFEFK